CIHFRAKTAWIPEVQEILFTHAMHSRTKLDACAVLRQEICGAPQLVGSVEPIRIMMDAAGNVGSVQNDSQVVRLLVRGDLTHEVNVAASDSYESSNPDAEMISLRRS